MEYEPRELNWFSLLSKPNFLTGEKLITFSLLLPNSIFLFLYFQNLKNQIMTTNLWVEQVRRTSTA
jgi:hypothetical protein